MLARFSLLLLLFASTAFAQFGSGESLRPVAPTVLELRYTTPGAAVPMPAKATVRGRKILVRQTIEVKPTTAPATLTTTVDVGAIKGGTYTVTWEQTRGEEGGLTTVREYVSDVTLAGTRNLSVSPIALGAFIAAVAGLAIWLLRR